MVYFGGFFSKLEFSRGFSIYYSPEGTAKLLWVEDIIFLSYIYLGYFVCLSVCHNCGTLIYSFSFGNQTDQGDETEGLKREGLKMERYGKGQIREGGCEETFHCLSQT